MIVKKIIPHLLVFIFFVSIATLFITLPAFAESVGLCPEGEIQGICKSNAIPSPSTIIKAAIQILLIAAVVLSLVFLIWGGIKWILSGGDKGKVEAARNTIIGAIIGLVIAFASYFILGLVATFFGLGSGDLLNLTLPTISGNSNTLTCSDTQHTEYSATTHQLECVDNN